MSEFSERLSELMFENNLNGKTLAQKLNISATCISTYLQGTYLPTVDKLIKFADFFKRSTDFLLGFEEENPNLTFKDCPPFCEQLEFLKEHFGCTAYQIYHNTGIAKSNYYEWKSGNHVPTLDNIIKLAQHFDCRVDFILGREV
jgi:hypothetical protein